MILINENHKPKLMIMKKIITFIVLMSIVMLGYAQKVYYGEIEKGISIGVGHHESFSPDIIFSIMITDHQPELGRYDIRVYDDGGYALSTLRLDRPDMVYNVKSGRNSWSHIIDFRVKRGDWRSLLSDMRHGYASITIDGTHFGGREFARVIDDLEEDRTSRIEIRGNLIWMSTPPTQILRYRAPQRPHRIHDRRIIRMRR